MRANQIIYVNKLILFRKPELFFLLSGANGQRRIKYLIFMCNFLKGTKYTNMSDI
jgi:hypothetical protein